MCVCVCVWGGGGENRGNTLAGIQSHLTAEVSVLTLAFPSRSLPNNKKCGFVQNWVLTPFPELQILETEHTKIGRLDQAGRLAQDS